MNFQKNNKKGRKKENEGQKKKLTKEITFVAAERVISPMLLCILMLKPSIVGFFQKELLICRKEEKEGKRMIGRISIKIAITRKLMNLTNNLKNF